MIRRYPGLLPVFLMLTMISIVSCKKDPYSIGLDLLPASDTLNVKKVDTCTVVAYSLIQDSIRSDKSTSILLGSIMDPEFGITTASLYTQLRLSTEAVSFGTNPVMDSLVLILPYGSTYGDITTPQNIKVYELSQDLFYDSLYYSKRRIAVNSTMLANLTFTPHPKDSVTVNGEVLYPQLRINLNHLTNYLGNKILDAPATSLATNESFLTFMKGLNIETTPVYSQGGLMMFPISATQSKMILYYHNSENNSLQFTFTIGTETAYFTRLDHREYADASPDFRRELISHDTTAGRNKLYLQGLGGVWTKVRFPYIKTFEKGHHIAINEVQLIMKNYETDTTLNPPVYINLVRRDTAGNIGSVIDSDEGSGYFGGTYDAGSRTYRFRITRHIQQLILGTTPDYDLFLMVNNPVSNVLSPYRVMLTGTQPTLPQSTSDRLHLQIIYTMID